MHRKLKKKPQCGTKNLSKEAKSRVLVVADIQNFTLRAHCMHSIPSNMLMSRALHKHVSHILVLESYTK